MKVVLLISRNPLKGASNGPQSIQSSVFDSEKLPPIKHCRVALVLLPLKHSVIAIDKPVVSCQKYTKPRMVSFCVSASQKPVSTIIVDKEFRTCVSIY